MVPFLCRKGLCRVTAAQKITVSPTQNYVKILNCYTVLY